MRSKNCGECFQTLKIRGFGNKIQESNDANPGRALLCSRSNLQMRALHIENK